MLIHDVSCKFELKHVESSYLERDFVYLGMKHENVVGIDMLKCFDRLHTCGLLDTLHDGCSSLAPKPSLARYDDPFLRDSNCDKHVMPLENDCLKLNMNSLYAKCTKGQKFVDWFERLGHMIGNDGAMHNGIIGDFGAWSLLCFYCTYVKPFNRIDMFYENFVKDFSVSESFVGYVVHSGMRMPSSHVRAYVLKLLEQLRRAYFDKFLMLVDFAFNKFHVPYVEPILYVVHNGLGFLCLPINGRFLRMLEHLSENHFDNLESLLSISCKLEILWRNALYTCKINVSWGDDDDFSTNDLVIRDFAFNPINVEPNFAFYEDPFMTIPRAYEFAKVSLHILLVGNEMSQLEATGYNMFDIFVFWHATCYYCITIKPFNGIGMFYGRIVKGFSSYDIGLGYKLWECLSLHYPILCVALGFWVGPTLPSLAMIFELFLFDLVSAPDTDLRANPFQAGEGDTSTGSYHGARRLRGPWIDWGPRNMPEREGTRLEGTRAMREVHRIEHEQKRSRGD